MSRVTAAAFAALLAVPWAAPAAGAQSPAAEPFPVVPLQSPPARSHTWAYVSLVTGATLVGLSFLYSGRADDHYAAYLASTDPDEIELLYARASRDDHRAQATLLAGEALVAFGIYLRFIRRAPRQKVSLSVGPARCAVSYRF